MGNLFAHAVLFFIFDISSARYKLRATSDEIALTKIRNDGNMNKLFFTVLIRP
jgi:hypothetical protein